MRGCACSLEARPLCTTAELWQAQRKATHILSGLCAAGVRGRSGQKSPRGTPESWHLLTLELATWRPAPPLFEPQRSEKTSLQTDARR